MKRAGNLHGWILFIGLSAGLLSSAGAEERLTTPSSADTATPSAQEVTQSIAAWADPTDLSRRDVLFTAVLAHPDPKEQRHLLRAFQQQQRTLTPPSQPAAFSAADLNALRWQVKFLPVGPEATVEDVQERDDVVAQIANVPDPDLRQQLLDRLREREQPAEEAITKPETGHHQSGGRR